MANAFSSSDASIGNFFSNGSGAAGECVFCGRSGLQVIDLSFNSLQTAHGTVPPVFQHVSGYNIYGDQRPVTSLLLGCGFTDIQPDAFAYAPLLGLDLSLNDLSSGLHVGSFNGLLRTPASLVWLALSNCCLRSASLTPGAFDWALPGELYLSGDTQLFLSNLVSPLQDQTRSPYAPYAPDFAFDPLQRAFSKERFTPPGQSWSFRPPTPAAFAASWGNLFIDFPTGVLLPPAQSALTAWPWSVIAIGEVVSMAPDAWVGKSIFIGVSLKPSILLSVAPSSVARPLMSAGQQYCPLHSIAAAINQARRNGNSSIIVRSIGMTGYDLPTTAECGDYPACVGCRLLGDGSMNNARTLSVEPAFLEPAFASWLSHTLGFAQLKQLSFVPPVLDMWSPTLNRSDWIDLGYFCQIDAANLVMPALPWSLSADPASPSFPFTPPAGLLSCLRDVPSVVQVDWSLARQFDATMLIGLDPLSHLIDWTFDITALYGTARPVPLGFFDALPASNTVAALNCNGMASLCARLQSRCPYLVDGICQPWSEHSGVPRAPPASTPRDAPLILTALCVVCQPCRLLVHRSLQLLLLLLLSSRLILQQHTQRAADFLVSVEYAERNVVNASLLVAVHAHRVSVCVCVCASPLGTYAASPASALCTPCAVGQTKNEAMRQGEPGSHGVLSSAISERALCLSPSLCLLCLTLGNYNELRGQSSPAACLQW